MSFGTLIEPVALWQRVARELARPPRALQRLALIALLGAFGPACAVYAGARWVSAWTDGDLGFLPMAEGRFDPFRATFVALLIAPALLTAMYLMLGRLFRLPHRPLAAFAVAVVGTLPVYAAGLTLVFPPAILVVVGAFMVSCFWWAVGARTLLGVSPDETAEFNAISIVGTVVLMQFAGVLLSPLV